MKIHLIENDDVEEIKREKHKPNLKLLTNDVYYFDTEEISTSFYELAEEEAVYAPNEKYTNNFNDKIMRQILKDKYQVAMNLNEWLNIKPGYEIKPEEITEITEKTENETQAGVIPVPSASEETKETKDPITRF